MKLARILASRTVACLLALCAGELAFDRAGFGTELGYRPDDRLGVRMLANRAQHQGGAYIRINSEGYREREWQPPGPNEVRCAVVGNSVTFGGAHAVEFTWPRLLERLSQVRAAQEPGTRSISARSYAVVGYRLEQMLRCFEDDVAARQPDVLLVALLPWDVAPIDPRREARGFGLGGAYVATATYDALARVANVRHRLDDELVREWEFRRTTVAMDPHGETARSWRAAAARRLAEVRAELARGGGRLALVVLPTLKDLLEPGWFDHAGFWRDWAASLPVSDDLPAPLVIDPLPVFAERQRELTDELRSLGLDPIRAGGELHNPKPDGPLRHLRQALFLDLVHLTERGHQELARQVYAALRDADVELRVR